MNPPQPDDTLTLLYDGACPLCRRGITHVRGLAQRQDSSALCFVDVSRDGGAATPAAERHHRDEVSALLAGAPLPWLLRAWCALVAAGSAAAVVLTRRM